MNARDPIHGAGQLIEPDITMLAPSPTNPRKHFDAEALRGLADSIAEHGIMQPIVVRELSDDARRALGTEARLEIIAGERRWRAAQLAGLKTVPCLLRVLSDDAAERLQVIENLQREGLSPIEESEGFARLMAQGLTADQVAETLGKSKAYIYAKLKLRALCDTVAQALHQSRISESVAVLIARLPLEADQLDALRHATTGDEYTGEPPSFRVVKAHIASSYTKPLSKAAFDPTDAALLPDAGTCTACPSRLGNMPGTEPANANVCSNRSCYNAKTAAHNVRLLGPDADAPRVDIPRANPKSVTTYADYAAAGYRLLSGINHADPQHRTYRAWLDDNSELVPTYVHVCPISGNAQVVASVEGLAGAAERIARRAAAAAAPDPEPEAAPATPEADDHFPDATKMMPTPAPARAQQPADPAPAVSRKQAGHAEYCAALRRACRTSPPMLIAWPLTRLIARLIASKVGGHIPDDATEADCIAAIVAYLTDSAYQTHDNGASLEELAEALNINHAEIRGFYMQSTEAGG